MKLFTLTDVKLSITKPENELVKLAEKKLGGKVQYFSIKKKSLDARDKNNLRWVYTIEFSDTKQKKQERSFHQLAKERTPVDPILVVGSGPAGLFCAVRLLDYGIKPILIERGAPVEEREQTINRFFENRVLDTETNVQFGEGGAGTFSDGKLNTQTHSPLNKEVLELFVKFGAPEEILWLAKPHIGSDNLKKVVKNIRNYIIERGGQVRFHTRLTDITTANGRIKTATLKTGQGEEKLPVSALVLAVGHSARDTFEMLYAKGIEMRSKEFAVGVRIEHLQEKIGFAQYGKSYSLLPPADYKLVSKGERAAFTFCMCPGGYVMPSASEVGGVVTNGMSNYARNGVNANSALIAQVRKNDFQSEHPLAGIEFQRRIERNAFLIGGETYAAPVQRVEDFLKGKESLSFGEVLPTYGAGTRLSNIDEVLPTPVTEALKRAILDMDKRLKGFADPDALLTAPETRTSSPVRIERGEDLQSVSVKGLFPCGEGAGYAGGITSSAADGLRVAEGIFQFFENGSIRLV